MTQDQQQIIIKDVTPFGTLSDSFDTKDNSIPIPFDSKQITEYLEFRENVPVFDREIYEQNFSIYIFLEDTGFPTEALHLYLKEWWQSPWTLDMSPEMIDTIFQRMISLHQEDKISYMIPADGYIFNFQEFKKYFAIPFFEEEIPKIQKYLSIRISPEDFYEEIFSDYPFLTQVFSLELNHTDITDVSALGNVHTLDLSYTGVTNVTKLRKVHILDLSGTRVSDVSALRRVYKLDLSDTDVTDVNVLKRVTILYLINTRVTDVSALRKVHTLYLSDSDVTDVSTLGGVTNLYLNRTGVTDVSALDKVHTLDLSFTGVTDVSTLSNVRTLYLSYPMSKSLDTSMLKNVNIICTSSY